MSPESGIDRSARTDAVERLVRDQVGAGYQVKPGPVWLKVIPARTQLPAHGWKLHISARAATFPQVIELLLPVLVDEGCMFKLARSQQILTLLNDGVTWPTSVGKAVTIYPDQRRVRELGFRLAEILSGHQGPRILSDRQVQDSAPVYYRYGPFASNWESDSHGRLAIPVRGPGGEEFDGEATLRYRQPSWATDPFTGETGGDDQLPGEPVLLGRRYRVTAGVHESARGNVYRAVDEHDGSAVIVKQARALVAEDVYQVDVRLRLRNERRILQVLDGVAGVPRFLDHFRHSNDEFLVTTDCGALTLEEDVEQNGCYRADVANGSRSLGLLAAQLARIVDDLHARGVVMRDLAPKNIVTGEEGPSIIDFGIAAYQGVHVGGATPGYAPARQQRNEPARETDDFHALGMTLLFAITRLNPVFSAEDPELSRIRALETIRSAYGKAPAGIICCVADLLSGDEESARTAFLCLASGRGATRRRIFTPLPTIPALTPDLLAEVTDSLLIDLLAEVRRMQDGWRDGPADHDAIIYSGSAGMGLELLQHAEDPRAADILCDLAAFTARAAGRVNLPPGLFTGITGVNVFLRQAARCGFEVSGLPPGLDMPDPDWVPESNVLNNDLVVGPVGVGIGHLWLYRATGDPGHLEASRRCIRILTLPGISDPPPARLPSGSDTDPPAGRAHGLAGITEFLLTMAEQTGDQPTFAIAAEHARQLARRTRVLVSQAERPATPPLAMGWCQGLAGIGPTLLQAGAVLQDASFTRLAKRAADACIAYVPRLGALGRCCGAAGVGNFLIDLAIGEQDQHYWDAAHDVAVHMLLRSAGPPGHPALTTPVPDGVDASWAFGLAGLLGFFRRLARPGTPDCLPLSPAGITPSP